MRETTVNVSVAVSQAYDLINDTWKPGVINFVLGRGRGIQALSEARFCRGNGIEAELEGYKGQNV